MTQRIISLLTVLLATMPIFANDDGTVNHVVVVLNIIAIVGTISAIVYGALSYLRDTRHSKEREREKYKRSFEKLVSQLNEKDNPSAQLSASILLRRYFKDTPEDDKKELRKEAIDVISSLLRVQST